MPALTASASQPAPLPKAGGSKLANGLRGTVSTARLETLNNAPQPGEAASQRPATSGAGAPNTRTRSPSRFANSLMGTVAKARKDGDPEPTATVANVTELAGVLASVFDVKL